MRAALRPARCGRPATTTGRGAFTLLELIVVLVILAGLFALLMPAVQSMRELSRRRNCEQKLIRLSIAIANYSNRHREYPAGTINPTGPIKSTASGYHHNWIEGLLLPLDAPQVYEAIDRSVSVYHPANDPVRKRMMPPLRCPSSEGVQENTTSYAAIHASTETPIDTDNDGTFMLNQRLGPDDITDGLSYTIFVGEKVSSPQSDLGWLSGTRSSLRNAGHRLKAGDAAAPPSEAIDAPADPLYVGGLASQHAGGVYLLMGSGECGFRSPAMDVQLLQQMASRAGSAESTDRLPEGELETAEPQPTVAEPQRTEGDAEASGNG